MLFPALILLWLLPIVALAQEDFYKVLGLDRSDFDERSLKKAYRKLSKQYHPDKNPNNESAHQKFVEISEAYEILSDAETRKIYNQYGHDGVKQHKQGGQRPGGHDPFDIFNRFFGGGGHFQQGQRRGPNMEVRIEVPLRDFYTGADHEFKIEKQAICQKCEGSGSEDGQREKCSKCAGHGAIVQKVQLAPGIFQQMQRQCDTCGGQGSMVKHKCKTCRGERVVREEERFDFSIEKGMPNGVRMTFENEADESPDWAAGDLIVHLVEKTPELSTEDVHKTDGTFFRRKDGNLFWREILSLREAWMGDWTRNLTHLDGHIVQLSRKRGQVVQPGAVEVVQEEGMPLWSENGDVEGHGGLHVEYVVVLPDQMEKTMEKEFFETWERWRKKKGVNLHKDSGRPQAKRDEL